MEKVIYQSDNGLSIVFEDIPPFLLSDIDTMGVGSIEDEDMSVGGLYNTYVAGYERRGIPIEIAVIGGVKGKGFDFGTLEELKRRLANTIDLRYQGELIYQNNTGAYSIRGRFKEIPSGFDRVGSGEKFSLVFVSTEQPKWKEREERVSRMGAVVGGVSFPLVFDPGVDFGTYNTTFEVLNDTYDELPVRITVTGTTSSVSVINETTGRFIHFNREITPGQVLEIDTEKGTAYVKSAVTGRTIENASHYLTLDSDYWTLQRGRNVITLDGGGQTTRPLGYLFWRKQFAGV